MRSPMDISSARSIAWATNSPGTSASFTAKVTSAIRAGRFIAEAPRDQDALVVADLDLDHDSRSAQHLAVLPRSPAG